MTMPASTTTKSTTQEQMNVVIVGHVDHGKSTVIGRLMADTHSLPQGKLEMVRAQCEAKSRPFEYAFLLDALKDEQSQGITFDAARCFFKTDKRHYIIIDAPGHIEFLKNMVTGASRAEAALLVIDAHEGIQENSKRHGYMLSMLGIRQVVVLVNKMDLVDYQEAAFHQIVSECTSFLEQLGLQPDEFIPVSAREGDNITQASPHMPWYKGHSLLEQVDEFSKRESTTTTPFRFPVQDIYKFTKRQDDRRIYAGSVYSGSVNVGDEVVFQPSGKSSVIRSVEGFNIDEKETGQFGEALGFTLDPQIYIKPGELMVKANDVQPYISHRVRVNLFWMGRNPMIMGRTYKVKIAATRTSARLAQIINVLDAAELETSQVKQQVERHDVAEVILEFTKPIAYDLVNYIETTGRLVIIDNYEIAAGGIILESLSDEGTLLESYLERRDRYWHYSAIQKEDRQGRYGHKPKFILITGAEGTGKQALAKALEQRLFKMNHKAYYLGMANIVHTLARDLQVEADLHGEHLRRLGELAHILTDSGLIFISTVSDLDDYDFERLEKLTAPYDILLLHVGDSLFHRVQPQLEFSVPFDVQQAAEQVVNQLRADRIILDYSI